MKTSAQIREELDSLRTKYQETAKTEFMAGIAPLFEKYPQLESIGFKAFTKYFNDGETCNYYARTDEPEINGFGPDEEDEEEDNPDENRKRNLWKEVDETIGYGDEKPNPRYNPESEKCIEAVQEFLGAFDDDIYMEIVGDHVEVTITKDGIETSEYTSHD